MDFEGENMMEENDSEAREQQQKLAKRLQDYKDTMKLIKSKMNKADALIREYNDKIKECNELNEELSMIKNEKQELSRKYHITMEKMAKIELTNTDYKHSFEKYKEMSDKQKVKLDENEKHITQLIFKIKNSEEQNLCLEEKIKLLELDNKLVKVTTKKSSVATKVQASQTISLATNDTSTVTDPIIIVPEKVKMIDESVMTDREKEPLPIYCNKCEVQITPAPIEQILKIMSINPPLLSNNLSPPNSPKVNESTVEINELPETTSTSIQTDKNEIVPYINYSEEHQNLMQIAEESKHLTFMEMDKLTRRMNKLENLIKKTRTKNKSNNSSRNCCSSKNIKFVLQYPNEEKFFEFRKREKRKLKRLYHQTKKYTSVKKKLNKSDWLVEDSKPTKRKISLMEENLSSKKKKNFEKDNAKDLFDCPEVVIPNSLSNDYLDKNICNLKECLSPLLPPDSPSSTSEMEIGEDEIKKSLTEDVNVVESLPKLRSTSCSSVTSQAFISKNIYETSLEKKTVPKQNFFIDINEKVSDKGSLPIRVDSIKKNKSIVAINNNIIESNSLTIEKSNNIDSNERVSIDDNIISNQIEKTNKNLVLPDDSSVSKVISDTQDELTHKNRHQIVQDKNNEQEKNFVSNHNSIQNNLKCSIIKDVNDIEKCRNSSYDEKNEHSTIESCGFNKVQNTEENTLTISSNVADEEIESLEEGEVEEEEQDEEKKEQDEEKENTELLNKAGISEIFSYRPDLSINQNISEGIVNEKSTGNKDLVFHKNNIHTNKLDDTCNLKIMNIENKSIQEDIQKCVEKNDTPLLFIPEETKLKDLQTGTITKTNTGKINDTDEESVDEIKKNNSVVEKLKNTLDSGVNDWLEPENSILLNENSNSSEESNTVSFSSALSDNICSNISNTHISENSCEENTKKLPYARTRNQLLNKNFKKKLAVANRKKLLSKIRNISKTSKDLKIQNKLQTQFKENISLQSSRKSDSISNMTLELSSNSKSELSTNSKNELSTNSNESFECVSNISVRPVKQRIAHIPKSINTDKISEFSKQQANLIEKNNMIIKEEVKETNDKVSSIIAELNKNFSTKQKDTNPSTTLEENVLSYNSPIKSLLPNNLSSLKKESEDENNTSVNVKNNNITNIITDNVVNVSKSNENENTIDFNAEASKITLRKFKGHKIKIELGDLQNDDVPSIQNKTINIPDEIKRNKRTLESLNSSQNRSPVRALRSREITINNECSAPKKLRKKKNPKIKTINEMNSSLYDTTVVSCLNSCLSDPKELNKFFKKKIDGVQYKANEKFVLNQLRQLACIEDWTTKFHSKIVDNLIDSQDLTSIANFIIEYAADKVTDDIFDKSHTPPAPLMTRTEQKLVILINEINKQWPNFTDIIIKGLQFKLFRCFSTKIPKQTHSLERLFRILVVLNKIKKDREKVRIFCCDALYCLNFRAINIIYVALVCWPEVLPKYNPNNDIIVKTIVYVLMTLKVDTPSHKLTALRKLLFGHYKYPNSGYVPENMKADILKNLQENRPGVKTAILLLCKRMGPEWSLQHIVKELKQIIVAQTHPSLYDVLTLLGCILRPVPINSNFKEIFETIDQLCDVLENSTGDDDLQESIVSCLISISKFSYERIAQCLLRWPFDKELRTSTKLKLIAFFKCHDYKWWWKFINQYFPPLNQN